MNAGSPHSAGSDPIVRYSVGHRTHVGIEPGEIVVLLHEPARGEVADPAAARLAKLFDIARPLLTTGRRVRVVASGASLPDSWPEWVDRVDNLVLTELGAYRTMNPITATRGLAEDAQAWLRAVIDRSGAGVDPAPGLFASLASRCLQPLFEAVSFANGLAAAHPDATIHSVDAGWAGLEYLRRRIDRSGGTVLPPRRAPRRSGRAAFCIRAGWRLSLAIAGQILRYMRAASSRAALRRHARAGSPRLWLALQPDWARVNRHLIAEFLPEPARDFGILLTATLVPGNVDGGPKTGATVWPGVPDQLIHRLPPPVVDQAVAPDGLADLIVDIARASLVSLRSIWRSIQRESPLIDLVGGLADPRNADGLARLLTTDVVQAEMVDAAVRRLAQRRRLRNSTVVFANLNLVDTAAADTALRAVGATTVDFRHGSGGFGWYGEHESFASRILGRSAIDATLIRLLSRTPAVTARPASPAPSLVTTNERDAARPPTKILIVTGYNHDSWEEAGFPLGPFEIELMRGLGILQSEYPELALRWRPHPSDNRDEVAKRLVRFPFLSMSDQPDLSEDLAKADLVITYGGSTLTQTVQMGVPVMVHAIPALLSYPDMAAVDPERRFFYAAELADRYRRFREQDAGARQAVDCRLFDSFFDTAGEIPVIAGLDFSGLDGPQK